MSKKTERKRELPKGWREVKLGDVGSFSKGNGISKNELTETGIPCVRYGELYTSHHFKIQNFYSFINGLDRNKYKLIKDNDLLFAGSGETREEIGKCASFNQKTEAYAGGDVIVYSIIPKELRADFASFYLNTEGRKQINKLGQGNSIVHIYSRFLQNVEIPLPPLHEQKAIASLLEKWDTAIEKTEALITAKKKQFKWLLKRLISDQQDNPKWQKVKLGDLGKIVTGTTPPTNTQEYYGGSLYPFITPTDIDSRKNISRSERYLTEKGIKKGRLIPKGSLLVTCIASIGKNVVLDVDGSCNQQINAIIPFDDYDVEYLYFMMETSSKHLLKFAGRSATAIINKNMFSDIHFYIPQYKEQKGIAKTLNTAKKEVTLLKDLAEQYRTQKRGIMQKLLTGEWKVGL